MEIYLDHAATTPLDPDVLIAMKPYLLGEYGNPSSPYALGRRARMAIDEARERVALTIGAQPSEITFTSGGTESDNAAIQGVVSRQIEKRHVVTTTIEHEAVLSTCAALESAHEIDVTYVQPGVDGSISAAAIEANLRGDTCLVSVMHANNEIGTIQPISEIGAVCRKSGVPLHVDAVQSAGTIDVNVDNLCVDLLSLSAHKFFGPKGVGAIYIRAGTSWSAQQLGGGQERTRRSGTENVAGIVGMAAALDKAAGGRQASTESLTGLRNYLFSELMSADLGDTANGSLTNRLPGNVNICFNGVNGEALVMALDQVGIAASTGSACSSGSTEPSHVLLAIGRTPEMAGSALRLTLGRTNTQVEVEAAGRQIRSIVSRLRSSRTAPAA